MPIDADLELSLDTEITLTKRELIEFAGYMVQSVLILALYGKWDPAEAARRLVSSHDGSHPEALPSAVRAVDSFLAKGKRIPPEGL